MSWHPDIQFPKKTCTKDFFPAHKNSELSKEKSRKVVFAYNPLWQVPELQLFHFSPLSHLRINRTTNVMEFKSLLVWLKKIFPPFKTNIQTFFLSIYISFFTKKARRIPLLLLLRAKPEPWKSPIPAKYNLRTTKWRQEWHRGRWLNDTVYISWKPFLWVRHRAEEDSVRWI